MSKKVLYITLGLAGTTGLAGLAIWKFWKSKSKDVSISTQTSPEDERHYMDQGGGQNVIDRPLWREIQPEQEVEGLDPESKDYNIYRHGVKRLVVFVVNMDYSRVPGTENRNYAVEDKTKNVFKDYLGFEGYNILDKDNEIVMNVDQEQFISLLNRIKGRLEKESVGCLAIIISSHGKEKTIGATQGRPGHREHFITLCDGYDFPTKDLIHFFKPADRYKGTVIPKLFVIQACRAMQTAGGDNPTQTGVQMKSYDTGVTIHIVDEDSDNDEEVVDRVPTEGASFMGTESLHHDLPAVPPCAPDCVVLFSAAPGMESYCNNRTGSWILQSLYEEVKKMDEHNERKISLFALLTRVNCNMATRTTENMDKQYLKSTGSFTHKLQKCLTLNVLESVSKDS